MSMVDAVSQRLIVWGDHFLPPRCSDPSTLQRVRATIVGSWLGLFFSVSTGLSYQWAGSPKAALSIHFITAGLLATPFAIRRGVSTMTVGNFMVALTAQAAVVVTWRSGGFESPSASWFFMLPVIAYLACGHRFAVAWTGFSVAGLGAFFWMQRIGVVMKSDFSPQMLEILRVSGYSGVICSTTALLVMLEGVRAAAERTFEAGRRSQERERILRDLHDGVGSQLLGLIVRARANKVDAPTIAQELQGCFDDLRLILDSLDPSEPALHETLAQIRPRIYSQCESLGVALTWECDDTAGLRLPVDATLQLLRAVQEMLSNALRHGKPRHLTLRMTLERLPDSRLNVSVQDDGVGFSVDASLPGRGLPSLRSRAQKLKGTLNIVSSEAGTRVALSIPAPAGK